MLKELTPEALASALADVPVEAVRVYAEALAQYPHPFPDESWRGDVTDCGLCYYAQAWFEQNHRADANAYIIWEKLDDAGLVPPSADIMSGPTAARRGWAKKLAAVLEDLLAAQAHAPVVPPPVPVLPTPYTPRLPKEGTQAARVLAALLNARGNFMGPQIQGIAEAAGTSETGASARIRELRSKYGWEIELHHKRPHKGKTLYWYKIRAVSPSVPA